MATIRVVWEKYPISEGFGSGITISQHSIPVFFVWSFLSVFFERDNPYFFKVFEFPKELDHTENASTVGFGAV